eukprot:2258528-Pyramimonas_sp.AAC.1
MVIPGMFLGILKYSSLSILTPCRKAPAASPAKHESRLHAAMLHKRFCMKGEHVGESRRSFSSYFSSKPLPTMRRGLELGIVVAAFVCPNCAALDLRRLVNLLGHRRGDDRNCAVLGPGTPFLDER